MRSTVSRGSACGAAVSANDHNVSPGATVCAVSAGARTTVAQNAGGSSIPKSRRPKGGWSDPAPQGA